MCICYRCSNLRCLTITEVNFGVKDVLKRFPELEELNLTMKSPLDEQDVGSMLPIISLLKKPVSDPQQSGFLEEPEYYLCSFVIAHHIGGNMPQLRRLRLDGFVVYETVLESILDGCPKLQRLDVRGCKAFHLQSARPLLDRCRNQIEDLRLPQQLVYDDALGSVTYRVENAV